MQKSANAKKKGAGMSKMDEAKFEHFAQEAKKEGACAVICMVTDADGKGTSLFYEGQAIAVLLAAGAGFLKITSDLHIGLDAALRIVRKKIEDAQMEK